MVSRAAFLIPSSTSDQKRETSSLAYSAQSTPRGAQAFLYSPTYALPVEPHSISLEDVARWRQRNEGDRLRPPAAGSSSKETLSGYRAPQHPASHVLHSIPPRAPSRSSRSNILSYTLHLATSSRLSSYSSPTGSRSLLYLAESERDQHDDVVCIDDAWFDAEQKTQGLWKLGANLLQSSRREGGLPPSVERRVDLAGLAEDLLLAPSADRAVAKIDTDSVQPSSDVHELVALKALTAPDPTTLYHTTSTTSTLATSSGNEGGSAQAPVHSVAQSLIDLKFGGKADPSDAVSPSFDDNKPLPHLLLDDPSSASSSSHAAPHMDYRIVAGQNMRTRARSIFSTSPLPALTASYCRSHRVPSCTVCASIVSTASERESNHATMRRKNVPGSGLRFVASMTLAQGGGAKKPLVALLPDFIKLSAALLSDVKERANRPMSTGDDAVDEALLASIVKTEEASPSFSTVPLPLDKGKSKEVEASASTVSVEMQVTAEWYDLLTHLLVQACLEGYLVDGWTGTEGVETLFGVGCGVWEGRGWSAKQPLPSSFSSAPLRERRERRRSPDDAGSSSDESSEDEDEQAEREAEELRRKKEDETRALVEAARALFGSRDVAQADYERTLRDKTHEFLNVPQDKTLHQHLDALSVKYPLSRFEDAMVDWLEAGVRLLGKPALAKYDPRTSSSHASTPSTTTPSAAQHDAAPDPFALIRYFAPSSFTSPPTLVRLPSRGSDDAREEGRSRRPYRPWEESSESASGLGKRRRVD